MMKSTTIDTSLSDTSNNTDKSIDEKAKKDSRYGACEICKQEGNDYFKKKDYKKAIEAYEKTIRFLGVLYKKPERHISNHFRLACYLNIALCYIKLNQYYDAITHCDLALEIDPNNVKAFYRKGLAYMKAQRFEEAKKQFQKVLTIDENNEDAKRKLKELNEQIQKHEKKEKKKFGGWLNKVEMYPDKKVPVPQKQSVLSSYMQLLKNNIWVVIIIMLIVVLLCIYIYNKAH